MGTSFLRTLCAGAIVGVSFGPFSIAMADDAALLLGGASKPGQQLFEREWKASDALSGRGDGLGPMFNARSCVACHHQQGTGGGGGTQHNVDLLTLVDFTEDKDSRVALQILHPGFNTANSVTLHSQCTDRTYEPYRSALLGAGRPKVHSINISRVAEGGKEFIQWGTARLMHSQRNTPSLFGAGLIDTISDQALAELARRNVLRLQGVDVDADPKTLSIAKRQAIAVQDDTKSRAARLSATASRRFGWKGQTPTLKSFVAGACANELGLQTKGNPQAAKVTNVSYREEYVDMTAKQLDDLVEFVAELPPPKRWNPSSDIEAASMARGALLFGQAKCQTCHVQDVENVRGIYSDLQLHDMGSGLADPTGRALTTSTPRGVPSRAVRPEDYDDPDKVITPQIGTGSSQPYYGPTILDLASVWRTPPLWGVRDSAPYLHDGRAATLDEAIKWHGGEAEESATRYRGMSASERRDLLAFVYSLGAP
jgi:CxxC motif-containing protein (DUF1111 family)